jgi:uncharacterized protein
VAVAERSDRTGDLVARLRGALPGLVAVYRFGSTQDGTAGPESDIDLAVLARAPLDVVDLWELAQRLAAEVGRDVDLIDLRRASTVLRYQVLTAGERVWCVDPVACDRWETTMASMYLRFNEERAEILEAIRERGTVF